MRLLATRQWQNRPFVISIPWKNKKKRTNWISIKFPRSAVLSFARVLRKNEIKEKRKWDTDNEEEEEEVEEEEKEEEEEEKEEEEEEKEDEEEDKKVDAKLEAGEKVRQMIGPTRKSSMEWEHS